MDRCTNNPCISPNNVNPTLKKLFQFIQQNQVSPLGNLTGTTLYLKLSLTAVQSPLDKTPRQSAANTVSGIITAIEDTYVVLIAPGICPGKYTEYTVNYSQIIEIVNYSISGNMKLLENQLNDLPPLCYEPNNQYSKMIYSLKKAISITENDTTKAIKIMFNEVNGRVVYGSIIILKNLLIIEGFFVFPITSITGFIISPICNDISLTSDNIPTNIQSTTEAGVLNV